MKINIFGMGYVGVVSAACLAKCGHQVTGIDIDQVKVDMINNGRSPIVEPGLEGLIAQAGNSGKFRATRDGFGPADISIICVGTPSNENGSLNLSFVRKVSEQIGSYLKNISSYHVVNFRSTVLPGTIEGKMIPILEKMSGKKAGRDFGVCMNPEFMRESSSIHDFFHPSFTVIGAINEKSGEVVEKIYRDVEAPIIHTTIRVAEMVKYACNAFHAVKVTFANEIGNVCKNAGIDSHEVMNIFCQDTKLNLSPYYLKPGFAFGGSCLPKDVRALLYKAREMDLETPLLRSILPSNEEQIKAAYKMIKKSGKKNIGVLGLSFKPGTDDLRESPMVELIEMLIGKGYQVSIFDREVSLAKLFGSNKRFIETAIPHISSLMKNSISHVIEGSDVIVIGNKTDDAEKAFRAIDSDKIIIDLVKISPSPAGRNSHYRGLCW